MHSITKIKDSVTRLIAEGEEVLASKWQPNEPGVRYVAGGPPTHVDLQRFRQWQTRCHALLLMLGQFREAWEPHIGNTKSQNTFGATQSKQGALKGLLKSLDEGMLVTFKELVLAETFSDLIEQAEYLLEQKYILASGVIARAVLEERLRQLSELNQCQPSKERPTLSDFNTELYKRQVYDKLIFKHVDALAAVGNDAAHNKPGLKEADVKRLVSGVREFLQRFSS